MHEGAATLLEALWPTVLIGLAGLLLVYLFHVGPLGSLVPGAARWRGGSKQTEKLARMSEPATRCEVCLQETTMQCSRCKVVKYCSPECQRKHWNRGHKVECQPKGGGGAPSANGHAKKSGPKQPAKPLPESSNVLAKRMLFPYTDFVEFFNWRELVGEPCGLVNVGNSCYANAVLQCLTFTWPLARYLLEREHSAECEKGSNEFCFLCELESHVNRAIRGSVPIMPQRILARVRNVGASLGYGRQEDAHEFMRFAVDSMQATFLEEAGGEKNIDHATQETTLIHHIFGGKLQSQVKCMACLSESNTYESVLDLTVEITGSVNSLEGALHTFTSPEWLDGDNKYKCDKCNDYVKGCKRLSIHEGPNMLSIVLKRFQGGHFGKVNKAIAYPETLNLTPFMSGKGDKPGPYHLYGVVVHLDMLNSTFFGHYLCFVKDASGRWYEADDSDVKATTIDTVLAQKAYMLFYARSEPHPAPLIQSPPKTVPPSRNGTAPSKLPSKIASASRSASPSSVLTSEGIPLQSNGDVTSSSDSIGSVNGAAADSANGPRANGTENGEEMTSAEASSEANGSVEELEAIYTKGVVARMLQEADKENAFTPPENAFTPPETVSTAPGETSTTPPAVGTVGETAKPSSVEDEEGARFADSVLLAEPYPAAAVSEGLQGLETAASRGDQSPEVGRNGDPATLGRNGIPEVPGRQANEGRSGADESVTKGDGSGTSTERIPSSQPTPKTSAGAHPGTSAGAWNALPNADGTPPRARSNERKSPGTESRKRTAADVRRENRTAQSERKAAAAPAAVRTAQNGGAGVKRHPMKSTPAPALVSQPGASQVAPVQVTSALEEQGGEKLETEAEEQVKVGESGRVRGGASDGSGLASGSREKIALDFGGKSHSPEDLSLGGANAGVPETAARGKKRSTHHASDSAAPGSFGGGLSEASGVFTQNGGVFAKGGGAFTQDGSSFAQAGGAFTRESQLEELSRLLSNRPLETALDNDVWESVLGTGLPNPGGSPNPLPDESFLEDEDLEAPSQPEPLFLPTEKTGPFGGFSTDGASKGGPGVNTDAAAGKSESAGPFGLGSVPFTPIFTSQPSGKEGGRVKHGGSNSGLARGFFGPAKAKRKSDKRSVRMPEVVPNIAPLQEETASVSAGFGEEFGEDTPEFGGGFSETSEQFLEVPVDELVLTTDTSTDEKKSGGNNVKPKGIADLIENEDLLREVGKSADQRLRSVVKGKVESKAKQGRNDVCNCGSGKKWKKCHGKGLAA